MFSCKCFEKAILLKNVHLTFLSSHIIFDDIGTNNDKEDRIYFIIYAQEVVYLNICDFQGYAHKNYIIRFTIVGLFLFFLFQCRK